MLLAFGTYTFCHENNNSTLRVAEISGVDLAHPYTLYMDAISHSLFTFFMAIKHVTL